MNRQDTAGWDTAVQAGRDYEVCGWRVASALALMDVPGWAGATDAAPELRVRFGPVPVDGPGLQAMPDGAVHLSVPGVGRYQIGPYQGNGGQSITVDPDVDPQTEGGAAVLTAFLLGLVLSVLCHQRGLLPLRAAVVQIAGRAVAIVGPTGWGKSALAFALARRGHAVMADTPAVLRGQPDGVEALPVTPCLTVWADTLRAFGLTPGEGDGGYRLREGVERFRVRGGAGEAASACPLHTILLLRAGEGPVIERISPPAAVPLLVGQVMMAEAAGLPFQPGRVLAASTGVAARVPVWRVRRPLDFARMADVVRVVEDRVTA